MMKAFTYRLVPLLICATSAIAGEKNNDEALWADLLQGKDVNLLWKAATNSDGKDGGKVDTRWQLHNGILSLDPERSGTGGSIETKKNYFNFELKFEFNIAKDSNSGLKYRIKNSIGFEYQLLDDKTYADSDNPDHSTAAIYAFQGVSKARKLNPTGEWNTGKIIILGTQIEHWLNGVKVASIDTQSELAQKRFKQSRFFEDGVLDFGKHKGPLHLQGFSDTKIIFRKMLIREITPTSIPKK